MWRRCLGTLMIICGLTGSTYLMWCQHRVSFPVLMADPAWPRPWPYPDRWLERWYHQIDAENPVAPGQVKMCGEWYTLMGRVRGYTGSTFTIIATGIALLLWPIRRQWSRQASVYRGVAIGLVMGAAWAEPIGHGGEEPHSVWVLFAIYVTAFAIAGAVVGVVREYPELVGLCAGFLALVVVSVLSSFEVDAFRMLKSKHGFNSQDFLRNMLDVDRRLAWFLVVGGPGLLCGLIIGIGHRLFRSARYSAE